MSVVERTRAATSEGGETENALTSLFVAGGAGEIPLSEGASRAVAWFTQLAFLEKLAILTHTVGNLKSWRVLPTSTATAENAFEVISKNETAGVHTALLYYQAEPVGEGGVALNLVSDNKNNSTVFVTSKNSTHACIKLTHTNASGSEAGDAAAAMLNLNAVKGAEGGTTVQGIRIGSEDATPNSKGAFATYVRGTGGSLVNVYRHLASGVMEILEQESAPGTAESKKPYLYFESGKLWVKVLGVATALGEGIQTATEPPLQVIAGNITIKAEGITTPFVKLEGLDVKRIEGEACTLKTAQTITAKKIVEVTGNVEEGLSLKGIAPTAAATGVAANKTIFRVLGANGGAGTAGNGGTAILGGIDCNAGQGGKGTIGGNTAVIGGAGAEIKFGETSGATGGEAVKTGAGSGAATGGGGGGFGFRSGKGGTALNEGSGVATGGPGGNMKALAVGGGEATNVGTGNTKGGLGGEFSFSAGQGGEAKTEGEGAGRKATGGTGGNVKFTAGAAGVAKINEPGEKIEGTGGSVLFRAGSSQVSEALSGSIEFITGKEGSLPLASTRLKILGTGVIEAKGELKGEAATFAKTLKVTEGVTFEGALTAKAIEGTSGAFSTTLKVKEATTLEGELKGEAAVFEKTLKVKEATTLEGELKAKAVEATSGNFTTTLKVKEGSTLEGAATVAKTLKVKETLTAEGAAVVEKTLKVAEEAKLEGAVVASKTLKVAEESKLEGAVVATKTLKVGEGSTLEGAVTASKTLKVNEGITGETTLKVVGESKLEGAVVAAKTLKVKETLTAEGAATVAKTLKVTETLTGEAAVVAGTTLQVKSTATLEETCKVGKKLTVETQGIEVVAGMTTLNGGLTVVGALTLPSESVKQNFIQASLTTMGTPVRELAQL